MKLFTPLPDSLEALTPDEVNALLEERRELARKIRANDEETVGGMPPQDILDELAAGVEQIKALEAEVALRSEAEENFEAELARLGAEAGIEETVAEGDKATGDETDEATDAAEGDEAAAEGDGAADETEADAEAVEQEAVAAAARPLRRPLPKPTRDREAVTIEQGLPTLVASGGLTSVREGEPLDRMGLAMALAERHRRGGFGRGAEDVVVASAKWEYPEPRRLREGDAVGNFKKIMDVVGPEALGVDPLTGQEVLLADGGICAPPTPLYDLPQISSQVRPLKASLPAFQADRGGITWGAPFSIGDVTDQIGIVTEAEDAAGGTFATKTCGRFDCPDLSTALIQAIYHCVIWGNMDARSWPERVAQANDVVMSGWARLAEGSILDKMAADSTQVTAAEATYGYGALSNLTSQVLVAAAGYRSRFRTSPDQRFRFVAPQWTRDLLLSDLINSQFGRFDLGYDDVDAFFRARGVDPIWYLDQQAGGAQVFGAQGAGALITFPDAVKWFLYPEGTWLFLDGGTLDIGIVRDSILNEQNDFQNFGEAFETVARVGFQSLEITSIVCPSGATGGPTTIIDCTP